MITYLRESILFFGMGILGMGCASGPLRSLDHEPEFPADLPSEVRQKFEVKLNEGAEGQLPSHKILLNEGGRKRGKIKKSRKRLPAERAPFVFPTRRPDREPIYVGEKLFYSIQYLGLLAGDLEVEALPFKKVNQRKVYHIRATARSSPVFTLFYRLHDQVETFIDFQGIFSHRFHLLIDESKQTRNSLELNDSEKRQTFYWNLWDHKTIGHQETKEYSPIEPFSQDSVSALYYLRTVPLEVGRDIHFPLVTEGKTWEAVCKVLRKESVNTPFGRTQAFVIQPEMKYQGILKKTGDSFLWLTDDERRIPVRLEAKVKIGSVVAQLREAELGSKPESVEPLSIRENDTSVTSGK